MDHKALQAGFEPAPMVKILLNIGALLDIPTGTYVTGRYGESILNGGLAALTGIVGIGNNFKSTVMHFMLVTVMSRMKGSTANTYDTEVNIHEWHLKEMIRRVFTEIGSDISEGDVLDLMQWIITDKTVYTGTEWYTILKKFLENKRKVADKILVTTPFWNRDRSGPMMIPQVTLTEIDSFTEFETDDVMEMQDKADLGDSKGNTIHMRQGLAKLRMLMEAPRLHAGAYNYLMMTAHIGKESTMQSAGGGREIPIGKLKHLKNGDKIKGTTDKFTFITHNCWHCYNASPLINDGTKGPEYPRDDDPNVKLDTDLNTVMVRNLRSKSGISGMAVALIVSQTEGVLPSLTEFHHIKDQDRYGLEGSNVSYALSLLPEVKLSRTTVRGKIDTNPVLRRALNITSEMCQISYLWHTLEEELVCTPKQLYEDLKALGYDWSVLLATRGWWTYDNDKHPVPFLSTMDLMRMRAGWYHPYWMDLLPGMTERPTRAKPFKHTAELAGAPVVPKSVVRSEAKKAAKAEEE